MKRPPKRTTQRVALPHLRVRALVTDRSRGQLLAGGAIVPCALGRAGITQTKREGDGASPRGRFRLRGGVYRPDHFASRPASPLPLAPSAPGDGWCDDARDRRYNRPIALPAPGVGHERLWREDGLYDLVVDLDYNRGPIRRGRGSAIFLHVARPGFLPTEGCVALRRADLVRLLRRIGPRTHLWIG
ncbi:MULTISPECIES: L,D-transpeptidase family protein [unclassified Methylobacterium]|uniref:L,D-transpeptidase family protein n=1 Tax=unclassified Methylobacterium TaxID=2615210 RepID=UPI0006FC3D9B|nr:MULTISPECIES: L,D-transpeptidase family protein [unclassified Methylobacterium]KQP77557.1 L,D-transpeptidase catalytic domain protein [Methylobacterium sp. Leaf113]KQP83076.1 L,D-transpeptidase catalytic domain protein [Methylobacterium sp. Leaf117]MCK2053623.1 L,D-transpeptidase family protein [Methylobacterium sp. 37f]